VKSIFLNGRQLRAGWRFLVFAIAMASLLFALQAVIAKIAALLLSFIAFSRVFPNKQSPTA